MRSHFYISNSFVDTEANYAVVPNRCAFRCNLCGERTVLLLFIDYVFESFILKTFNVHKKLLSWTRRNV